MRSAIFDCSDDRDRVFATLSMIRSRIDRQYNLLGRTEKGTLYVLDGFPAITYSKSRSEVFQDFVKQAFNLFLDI
jgi:hypothetical protein